MGAVRIAVGEYTAAIYFKYDEELVDLVRGFPGRQYNVAEKFWTIEKEDAQKFKNAAERLGHRVVVTVSSKHEEDKATRDRKQREEQARERRNRDKARNAYQESKRKEEEKQQQNRDRGRQQYNNYWDDFFYQEQERRNREYARRQQQGAYDDPRNWQNRQGQGQSSGAGAGYSPGMTSADGNGWAVLMFRAVGKDHAKSVYRAMSRALHPDVAGDSGTELMKQLNAAYERWK